MNPKLETDISNLSIISIRNSKLGKFYPYTKWELNNIKHANYQEHNIPKICLNKDKCVPAMIGYYIISLLLEEPTPFNWRI